MAPRNVDTVMWGIEERVVQPVATPQLMQQKRPPNRLVWRNIIWLVYLHVAAFYGLYLIFYCHKRTLLWGVACYVMGALGITAGAHRHWSHRSYKAKLPLQVLLVLFNSMAFQNDVIEWSRDHRVHHKYSETDADPHNAKRGFFFAHCGWLLVRKHPDVKAKGKGVDIKDLLCDPLLALQKRFYMPSVLLLCFLMPTFVPWYFWSESVWNGFFVCGCLRYILSLHATWLVNSAAHMWGNHPYDKTIHPAENLAVAVGAVGEGFHNYHHTFPQDYATSEFGWKLNVTSLFIDLMAALGQVTDRRTMSAEMIAKRRQRTGDGTHSFRLVGAGYGGASAKEKQN